MCPFSVVNIKEQRHSLPSQILGVFIGQISRVSPGIVIRLPRGSGALLLGNGLLLVPV